MINKIFSNKKKYDFRACGYEWKMEHYGYTKKTCYGMQIIHISKSFLSFNVKPLKCVLYWLFQTANIHQRSHSDITPPQSSFVSSPSSYNSSPSNKQPPYTSMSPKVNTSNNNNTSVLSYQQQQQQQRVSHNNN